jgi:peptidoglycan L-alanyl-D-glutamate endopeptidase CwlK
MPNALSNRSLKNLEGVEPSLVRVVLRALSLSPFDFMVGEGKRTAARQKNLVAKGKSRTMKSRHIFGFAVDLWVLTGGKVDWTFDRYRELAAVMKRAAVLEGVPIEWGGEIWATASRPFIDGPHFQLPKCEYPDP